MDLASLRDAKPNGLYDCAGVYDQLAATFRQHVDEWQTTVVNRTTNSGWFGVAADSCESSLKQTDAKLTSARTELLLIGATLRAGADAFLLAQSKLVEALNEAQAAGLTVNESGAVSWPPPTTSERHDPDYQNSEAKGQDLARRITAALAEADTADKAVVDQLHTFTQSAKDGSGLFYQGFAPDPLNPVITAPDFLTKGMPPKDASPTEINSWWRGLTPDEQQRLITTHPDLIGNRDGIPAVARDQANRLNLETLLTKYQSMKQLLSEDQQRKLDGFVSIRKRLADETAAPGAPPVLLLGVSDEGQGRGILSFGNPDTAENVTSFVGGYGTELRRVGGGDADRAKAVYDAARQADPNRSTASIVWLGYDAPLKSGNDVGAVDVGTDERAKVGAVSYDNFLAGQRATHEGAPAHVTALGHSYGSLLVGQAAQRPGGIAADDVILLGSPGTGADRASQLSVGAANVYVGAADNDYVTRLPSSAEVGGGVGAGAAAGFLAGGPVGAAVGAADGLTGAALWPRATDDHAAWFGQDPASSAFGAQRFLVAPGATNGSAHSAYWDTAKDGSGATTYSSSLENIGKIVTGRGGEITREQGR